MPDRAPAILNRIRDVRKGDLTCSDFGIRMNGEGKIAVTIEQLFQSSCKRLHLNESRISLATDRFCGQSAGQMEIF
jgi:hypothetical protein